MTNDKRNLIKNIKHFLFETETRINPVVAVIFAEVAIVIALVFLYSGVSLISSFAFSSSVTFAILFCALGYAYVRRNKLPTENLTIAVLELHHNSVDAKAALEKIEPIQLNGKVLSTTNEQREITKRGNSENVTIPKEWANKFGKTVSKEQYLKLENGQDCIVFFNQVNGEKKI